MNNEIVHQLQMTYEEQCSYLQKKYGLPKHDYYCNESCKSKSNISRTSEGLYVHHNAEEFGGNLQHPAIAKIYPFEYQKKENLSYCNNIEHMLLHLKISAKCCSVFDWPWEFQYFFNTIGFFWIANDINTMYKEKGSEVKWRNNCYLAIKPLFDDYVSILKGVFCFLEENYIGDKDIQLFKGQKLCLDRLGDTFRDIRDVFNRERKDIKNRHKRGMITITDLCYDENKFEMISDFENVDNYNLCFDFNILYKVQWTPNGNTIVGDIRSLENLFSLKRQINHYATDICKLFDGTLWTELMEELRKPYSDQDKMIAGWIKNYI